MHTCLFSFIEFYHLLLAFSVRFSLLLAIFFGGYGHLHKFFFFFLYLLLAFAFHLVVEKS